MAVSREPVDLDLEAMVGLEHTPREGVAVLGEEGEAIRFILEASRTEGSLNLSFCVVQQTSGPTQEQAPEWHYRDHVVFMLDLEHSHARFLEVAVTRDGEVSVSRRTSVPGELPTDRFGSTSPCPEAELPEAEVHELGSGWGGTLTIGALGSEVPVIGMLVKACAGGPPPALVRWPRHVPPDLGEVPLTFGDLYLESEGFEVEEIDLERLTWGENTARLSTNQAWATTALKVVLPGDGETLYESTGSPDILGFQLPFRGKWSPDVENTMRLELELRDEDGRSLWRGAYPSGFDAGVIVREIYGGAPSPRPEASDPQFIERYRAFLLSRLPNLKTRTTRDGAPSDFCVVDEERKLSFDLMESGVLGQMASWVAETFPDWRDGLCAASILLHGPALTIHSRSHPAFLSRATPETVLRVRACFCDHAAHVLAALIENLGCHYGLTFRTWRYGLRGHIVPAVETPDGMNVFDAMLGAFYYVLDNTRFATLDELRAVREISYRMNFNNVANGHEMYYGFEQNTLQEFGDGVMEFP